VVVRRDRKKIKLRGKRSHGAGNTKNRRGAGCRGGRGRAGSHKHKFSKYYVDFGVKRKLKTSRNKEKEGKAINIYSLNKIVEGLLMQKNCEKSEGMVVVDGRKIGVGKILGTGKAAGKVLLRNIRVSKKAGESIENAGGKIEKTKEGQDKEEPEKPAENKAENPKKEEGKRE